MAQLKDTIVTGNLRVTDLSLMGGDMTFDSNKGIKGKDASNADSYLLVHNLTNLWIGAYQGASTHHIGGTCISTGYNTSTGQGNTTIRVAVPNASNNNATVYDVLHTGNLSLIGSAGSATRPIYFSNGVPTITTAPVSGAWWSSFTGTINSSGILEVGRYIDFHSTNAGTTDYDMRLDASSTSLITLTSNNGGTSFRISGTTPRLRFTQTTSGKAFDSTNCGIVGYAADANGINMTVQSAGNMFIGGGESPTNLYFRVITTDTNPYGTSSMETEEHLFLTSDSRIYFVTSANGLSSTAYTDWTNLKTMVIDGDGSFKPTVTNNGQIGDTSHYWSKSYVNAMFTESLTVSKDSSVPIVQVQRSDTNVRIALQVSTEGVNHGVWSSTTNGDKYLLYSDGTDSYIYTTTAEPASNTTLYPIAFFAAEASNAEKKIQHNDGLRYLTQAGTSSAVGQAYLVVGNATASGTAGNKKGVIRIYSQNKGYYQLDPTSTSSNITLTLPNTTGTVALDRASFITEAALTYSDTTSWHKFAQFTSSTATEDRVIVFIVSSTYYSSTIGTVGAKSGILVAHIRTSSGKALVAASSELTWLVAGSSINNTHFKMLYYNLDSSCRIELWCKVPEKYVGWAFNVIDEHSRISRAKAWTLYTNSTSGQAGVALPTDASGSIDSAYQSIKNPYTP